MKNIIKFSVLLLLLLTLNFSYAQSDKEKAHNKANQAVGLMDNGQIKQSINLLNEALKLDPGNYVYSYELAYANYLNQDYKQAIKILNKNKNHKDVSELLFQMLGNCYDIIGNSKKALKTYNDGLKKFPAAGCLYLEQGNVYWGKEEYNEALNFYEKGIEVDPLFPSNYYRATLLYCSSTEEVWGILYGEVFINLEQNTKRTETISKLLFDTYSSEIELKPDSNSYVSFSQNSTIYINDDMKAEDFKLPFGIGIYEPALLLSIIGEEQINLGSLYRIRTKFIDLYYSKEFNKSYPVALYDYHKKIIEAGHFEAYTYWILKNGNAQEYEKWKSENEDKWDDFELWYGENGIMLF